MNTINFNRILVPKGENRQPVVNYLGRAGLNIPELPKEYLHHQCAGRQGRI